MKRTLLLAAAPIIAALTLAAPAALAAGAGNAKGLATTSRSADVETAFSDGVEALKAGDNEKAEKNFDAVLTVAPNHPEANYYMALAKERSGKPKNAVRYLERAIKERPSFVEAREKLALIRIGQGERERAQEQLAAIEALKADCAASGDCEAAYLERADVAIARIGAALEPADEAVEEPAAQEGAAQEDADGEPQASLLFAPRAVGGERYGMAVRLINEGDYDRAIDALLAASAIVGPHPDILNYLGYTHRKIGKLNEAQDYYAAALAIDPDHRGATEYLGELYLEIGDIERARGQLARLDAICPFGCAEYEDLSRLLHRREGALAAN